MKSLNRVFSTVYASCRKAVSALIAGLRAGLSLAARLAKRLIANLRSGLGGLWSRLRGPTRGYMYYRHPLPLRIMHWCNVVLAVTLLMSGLNIFNAHPALYWGKQSYSGAPPVLEMRGVENDEGDITGVTRIFGHEFDTTGFLGASANPDGEMTAQGFPSWLTLPDYRWLSLARRWHLSFAWLFVINGVAFVAFAVVSGHLRRDLIPTRQDWRSVGRSIVDHIYLRHPAGEAARNYNVLQKCAYLGVIFLLLPLMVVMGLGMSPAMDAWPAGWVDIFAGRQSVRTIHFAIAWGLVLFVMIHVFEVIVSGFWNNVRSMITGNFRIEPEEGEKHG